MFETNPTQSNQSTKDEFTLPQPIWPWAIIYGLVWLLLYKVSTLDMYLMAGWRIGAFLVTRRSGWWMLGLSEITVFTAVSWHYDLYQTLAGYILGTWVPFVVMAAAFWRVVTHEDYPKTVQSIFRMFFWGALGSILATYSLVLSHAIEGSFHFGSATSEFFNLFVARAAPSLLLPSMMMSLVWPWKPRQAIKTMLQWLGFGLVPVLVLLVLCAAYYPVASEGLSIVAMGLLPIIAVRFGWRGGAWAAAIIAIAVVIFNRYASYLEPMPYPLMYLNMCMFLIISHSIGAVSDALRLSNKQSSSQLNALEHLNKELIQQGEELKLMSHRLVRLQEEEHQRIGEEVTDEVDQTLSKISTKLGLQVQDQVNPGMLMNIDTMREMLRNLRISIIGITRTFDSMGVSQNEWSQASFMDGPIGGTLYDVGIPLKVEMSGKNERIPADQRVIILKICYLFARATVRQPKVASVNIRVDSLQYDGDENASRIVLTYTEKLHESADVDNDQEQKKSIINSRVNDRVKSVEGSYSVSRVGKNQIHQVILPMQTQMVGLSKKTV